MAPPAGLGYDCAMQSPEKATDAAAALARRFLDLWRAQMQAMARLQPGAPPVMASDHERQERPKQKDAKRG